MNLFKYLKGSKLYSIFTGTCPVCQEESMYLEDNPYKITQIFEMHERCSHCHTKYKIEPSFFFGAMYVSYAVGIAFAVPAFFISFFLFDLHLLWCFAVIVLTLMVFMPFIIRISRNIWINFFLNYKPR
ncbi:MAG TPA: DUF983 domain-containing protein [Salinimicrobium sp.]|nr:DUF983 domain-containing protein [Salinimicrobium sp.]